ncbi:NAD dependent epimerase/dehydratase [Pseudovirgaria hyperparasitica]|uniref:NAD dependent epimerase/dehydratase n=1 Tax=Pseudovirgaria hyperparasitica TaxID=470096 RepID=A0A6A6WDG0_9PEZI|nr:NAD dependent epimerase/dehydratase [Pseudovirgaria hyperparasitica]KAF2759141.1 NAD dependent epimerase/dehydratase [Pseudovirgaria hyperparasitica]
MTSQRVLLLGGHGAIAQLMTPLFLRRSWSVTSVIRSADQIPTIRALGNGQPGTIDVLIESLDDVKTQAAAQSVIDKVQPNYIVWAAGAGGKGGAERTFAVDRDAATHYIRAAAASPGVSKFLMISYIGSRRGRAAWWSDESYKAVQEVNDGALANYHVAKLAADEVLVAAAKERGSEFAGICLRPGTLKEGSATGKILLGKTPGRGEVRRSDVAEVAVRLLEQDGVGTRWLDLVAGDEGIDQAIARVVKEGLDCYDGEG